MQSLFGDMVTVYRCLNWWTAGIIPSIASLTTWPVCWISIVGRMTIYHVCKYMYINLYIPIHPYTIYHIFTMCLPYIYHVFTIYFPYIYHIYTVYNLYDQFIYPFYDPCNLTAHGWTRGTANEWSGSRRGSKRRDGGTVNVVSHGKMPGLQCNIAIDG